MGNTLSEIRRRGAREAARKASSPDRVRSAREVLEEKKSLSHLGEKERKVERATKQIHEKNPALVDRLLKVGEADVEVTPEPESLQQARRMMVDKEYRDMEYRKSVGLAMIGVGEGVDSEANVVLLPKGETEESEKDLVLVKQELEKIEKDIAEFRAAVGDDSYPLVPSSRPVDQVVLFDARPKETMLNYQEFQDMQRLRRQNPRKYTYDVLSSMFRVSPREVQLLLKYAGAPLTVKVDDEYFGVYDVLPMSEFGKPIEIDLAGAEGEEERRKVEAIERRKQIERKLLARTSNE